MKKRILAILGTLGLAGVLTLGSVAPAQAFTPILYTADCPGNASSQQLVIVNTSSSFIQVDWARPNPPFGIQREVKVEQNRPWSYVLANQIGYVELLAGDKWEYRMYGDGGLNWFYHVDCFY